MKKVVFAFGMLCLFLMTQSACSGKSAKAEQITEQLAGESAASQNELLDKILGLIEDGTDKVKDCSDPKKAFTIMAETSKAIDKLVKMPVLLCRLGKKRLAMMTWNGMKMPQLNFNKR